MTSLITLNQHKNKKKIRHDGEFEECSTTGKLINRIPGSLLLISSLAMSTSVLKTLPGKLDIKRREPGILYLSDQSLKFGARKKENM